MTGTNPGSEDLEFESFIEIGFTEEEVKALFELPTRRIKKPVKPAGKIQASRHIFPMRSYEVELRNRRKAEAARKKAQREERKKEKQTMMLIGLAIVGKVLENLTKPIAPIAPVNVPVNVPSKPDEIIFEAEYRDLVDEPETKALSPGTQ